jgi:lipopolysaccharide/colanic/teichoic acid biosynthesis glycosyltransferase
MDIVLKDILSKKREDIRKNEIPVTEPVTEMARFIYSAVGQIDFRGESMFHTANPAKQFFNKEKNLLVDLSKINRVKDLNNHFNSVNSTLNQNGTYIGCFESRANKNNLNPFLISPRISKNNFAETSSKALPIAEILGRLVYCGFEITSYREFENTTCFIAKKIKAPLTEKISSGVILKMKRTGKNGKIIHIYKIRTMYPYSEFLQDYIVKCNGYNELGKPKNDFRLLPLGKVMRRFYIDELPQFINLLKGDINIIGTRPLSKAGLNYLPEDVQQERLKYKPGLIPPQIALRLKGIDGVIKAERKYLEEVKKNQVKTNIKYFFLAFFNIVTFKVKGN